MTYINLIWAMLDAKRFARMMAVDPIVRIDMMMEVMGL